MCMNVLMAESFLKKTGRNIPEEDWQYHSFLKKTIRNIPEEDWQIIPEKDWPNYF